MNTTLLDKTPDQGTMVFAPAAPAVARRPRFGRKPWIVAGLLALAAAAGMGWRSYSRAEAVPHTVATVKRADLARTISATGHVQAVVTVQVGSQISGTISELHADYNDRVTKGQVIARLDPSQLQAQFTQAQANVASAAAVVESARNGMAGAEAVVKSSQANVDRTESVVADAQRTYELNQKLVEEGVLARKDLDSSRAALAQAQAQKQQAVAQWAQSQAQALSARSQWEQAKAQAQQSKASLEVAQVNLERSVIRAPIDGVVVARNIDVGQTVAASLQAPTLFLIANDLTQMRVLADIDEADVGQLREGAEATFTVDAFPRDTFHGRVSQIRLSPQTVQNVVTYTAVIDVNNQSGKLKPGMTANLSVVVAQRKNVLTVPNGAFRFQPAATGTALGTAQSTVPVVQAASQPAAARRQRESTVWVVAEKGLEPVRVQTGMTDGISTEITGGALTEGEQVALPAQQTSAARQTARSPFGPTGPPAGGMRGGPRS